MADTSRIHLIGNAHLDPIWLWRWQEGFAEIKATFKSALEALKDPSAPIKEKNKLLKACIERITYSRKRTGNNGHPKKGEETPIMLDIKLRFLKLI